MKAQWLLPSLVVATALAADHAKAMYNPARGNIPFYQFLPIRNDWEPAQREDQTSQPHAPVNLPVAAATDHDTQHTGPANSSPLFLEPDSFERAKLREKFNWPGVLPALSASQAAEEGSSRQGPDHVRSIDSEGRLLGPFYAPADKYQPFQALPYRLDIPQLSHLYAPDETMPADFAAPGPFGEVKLSIKPLRYRPEPQVLANIHQIIVHHLRERDIKISQVYGASDSLYEGMFLWPPFIPTPSGLQFPAQSLDERYSRIPLQRLRNRIVGTPNVYRLVVPSPEGDRYVMMTTLRPGAYTTLTQETDSDLWLFYEGRRKIGAPRNRLALLGVMFLPKSAKDALMASSVISLFDTKRATSGALAALKHSVP